MCCRKAQKEGNLPSECQDSQKLAPNKISSGHHFEYELRVQSDCKLVTIPLSRLDVHPVAAVCERSLHDLESARQSLKSKLIGM